MNNIRPTTTRKATGLPYMVRHHYQHGHGKDTVTRSKIADREKGALRRLAAIVAERNAREAEPVTPYHQGDPRGCSLYILRQSDLAGIAGTSTTIDQIYTRGLAVCA